MIPVNFKKKNKRKVNSKLFAPTAQETKKCRQPKLCSIKTVQADFRIRLP